MPVAYCDQHNKTRTALAQIARLGPIISLKVPIRALKLAHNLGRPRTIFVVARRLGRAREGAAGRREPDGAAGAPRGGGCPEILRWHTLARPGRSRRIEQLFRGTVGPQREVQKRTGLAQTFAQLQNPVRDAQSKNGAQSER